MIRALQTAGILVKGLLAAPKPSLLGIVRQMERYYWRQNAVVATSAYPWPRRFLEAMTRHLFVAIISIALVYFAVAWLAVHALPISASLRAPAHVEDFYRDFLNINVGILTAQITLVALVYPLVIAMVGLLFEPRTTLGGRLSVFLQETAAIPTGCSALLLCAALAIQLLTTSQFPIRAIVTMTALNCVWFILNIAGLGFLFLANAIAYIHPGSRPRLLRRYTVNVAWRSELRTLMARNRLFNAVQYGYLPGSSGSEINSGVGDQNELEPIPKVLTHPFFRDLGDPVTSVTFRRKRTLIDVHLPTIAIVAEL